MQKVLCLITTECFANEGIGEAEWKQKGKVVFKLNIDPEDFFNAEDVFLLTIDQLLSELSDFQIKYIYSSHDLIFNEIQELKGYSEKFERLLSESY